LTSLRRLPLPVLLAVAIVVTVTAVVRHRGNDPGLKTFAGTWHGHTRGLVISSSGLVRETIYDGCCDHVVDVNAQLSKPHGPSARATVTYVHVFDRSAFAGRRPPRVGDRGTFTIRAGVLTEPITGTVYCDDRAENVGRCGA
jgi:hypothetical protein